MKKTVRSVQNTLRYKCHALQGIRHRHNPQGGCASGYRLPKQALAKPLAYPPSGPFMKHANFSLPDARTPERYSWGYVATWHLRGDARLRLRPLRVAQAG